MHTVCSTCSLDHLSLTNVTCRFKVKQQQDVAGLINLLPEADRREAQQIVVNNFQERVEEVVQHRMQLFKRHEEEAVQKTHALPDDERDFVFALAEVARVPAAIEKNNLDLLVQAVDQVDVAQDTIANLSLDQISVLEQLLADAKRNLLDKQAEAAAELSDRQQSIVSQATAAAEA
jgi:hypothetical protein